MVNKSSFDLFAFQFNLKNAIKLMVFWAYGIDKTWPMVFTHSIVKKLSL